MTPWQFPQSKATTAYNVASHIQYTEVCQCHDLLNTGTTEEEEDDADYRTVVLAGAIVATFFITLLVCTVVLVA